VAQETAILGKHVASLRSCCGHLLARHFTQKLCYYFNMLAVSAPIEEVPLTVKLVSEESCQLSEKIKILFTHLRSTHLQKEEKETSTDISSLDAKVLELLRQTWERSEEEETEEKDQNIKTVKYYVDCMEEARKEQKIDSEIIPQPLNEMVCRSPNGYLVSFIFLLHIVRTECDSWNYDGFPQQEGILEEMLLSHLFAETWTGTTFLCWLKFECF
jgi:hypothetical protein